MPTNQENVHVLAQRLSAGVDPQSWLNGCREMLKRHPLDQRHMLVVGRGDSALHFSGKVGELLKIIDKVELRATSRPTSGLCVG